MPRRRSRPPEPRSPAAESLLDRLRAACGAVLVVLGDVIGRSPLERTLRTSELALRRDVCVVVAMIDHPLTPAIDEACRAGAIRTAESISEVLAAAHELALASPRALHVAAFTLGELIEVLRHPRAATAAVTSWN